MTLSGVPDGEIGSTADQSQIRGGLQQVAIWLRYRRGNPSLERTIKL
jgi:hypothetical protein